jgi:predicted O-linked N-acetylglucosamine transferase (SPINDLY family)
MAPREKLPQRARLMTAIEAHQRGDLAAAEPIYRQLLSVTPRSFDVLHLLGALAVQKGDLAEGIALLRQAIAVDPEKASAHANLSKALLDGNDGAAALGAADRALALKADYPEAWYNRATALQSLARSHEAVAAYERALELRPDYPHALNNLGNLLREMRRPEPALECLERAVAQQPEFVGALNNLGLVHLDLRRTGQALAFFDRALEVSPEFAEALHNRGNALMILQRYPEAADAFARLAAVAPGFAFVHGNLLQARLHTCDWRDHHVLVERVTQLVEADACADLPFAFLCVSSSAALQLRCARTYTLRRFPAVPQAPSDGARAARQEAAAARIRVAYVSGDFGAHAVSYLLAGLFELHDRSRFEVIAISWGRHEDGPIRRRLEAAFDRFIDVTREGDDAIVTLLRDLKIDIAVDLAGHTRDQRTGIFARRPAPIQVNYLGLPGTMGADYIDYLIADRVLIPESRRSEYAEHVVWMPEGYQPSDAARAAAVTAPRASFGLPPAGLVLCSFNASPKLNPRVFDIWMRLLVAAPDTVLWLLAAHPAAADNLRREAMLRGVTAHRLVFAPRVGYAEYLGRYAHVDLFLDTLPFNAGATAGDALSQGVPVLTCAGDSFAARMSASLLTSLGLAALVTHDLESYEATALELLRGPQRLAKLRAALDEMRAGHAFFDTDRYRRHLESAFQHMWLRHSQGLLPESFAVDAVQPVQTDC